MYSDPASNLLICICASAFSSILLAKAASRLSAKYFLDTSERILNVMLAGASFIPFLIVTVKYFVLTGTTMPRPSFYAAIESFHSAYEEWFLYGIVYFAIAVAFKAVLLARSRSDCKLTFLVKLVLTCGLYLVWSVFAHIIDISYRNDLLVGKRVLRNPKIGNRAVAQLTRDEKDGLQLFDFLRYPRSFEETHQIVVGTTGSGKTQLIKRFLNPLLARKDKIFLYDSKGDYVDEYLDSAQAILISPFYREGVAWDAAKDIATEPQAVQFCNSLIPIPLEKKDSEWPEAARQLVIGGLLKVMAEKPGDWTFEDLFTLVSSKEKLIAACKSYRPEALNVIGTEIGDKQTAGIFMSIATATSNLKYLAAAWKNTTRKVSIRWWVSTQDEDRRMLIVKGHESYRFLDKMLVAHISDLLIETVLSLPDIKSKKTLNTKSNVPIKRKDRSIWIVNDEFGDMPKIPRLKAALEKGRSKGLKVLLGMQSIYQIKASYGKEYEIILDNIGTWFIGLTVGRDTARYFAESFGEKRVLKNSFSINSQNMTVTTSRAEENSKNLLDSDFTTIPKASLESGIQMWVKAADWPALKIVFDVQSSFNTHKDISLSDWVTETPKKVQETSNASVDDLAANLTIQSLRDRQYNAALPA